MGHHHHHHRKHTHHATPPAHKPLFRQQWLYVVAVALMLAAMLVYVLTMDESTVPEPGAPPAEQAADF
jgi:hypothetical protein